MTAYVRHTMNVCGTNPSNAPSQKEGLNRTERPQLKREYSREAAISILADKLAWACAMVYGSGASQYDRDDMKALLTAIAFPAEQKRDETTDSLSDTVNDEMRGA